MLQELVLLLQHGRQNMLALAWQTNENNNNTSSYPS
jgi:hypothetical protein